jgi:redox-sensitive bicupin YhaK (pirin superfamily)
MYATLLADGERVSHTLARARRAWVHVAEGEANVNGEALRAGDAVGITNESAIEIAGAGKGTSANVLLFDLGM